MITVFIQLVAVKQPWDATLREFKNSADTLNTLYGAAREGSSRAKRAPNPLFEHLGSVSLGEQRSFCST